MEIIDRKENSLLKRIEIKFQLRHDKEATPSRSNLRSKVASLEPGSMAANVIVKNVNTRFGQPMTTGLAFIYESSAAMQIEPQYILDRHGVEEVVEEAAAPAKPAVEVPAVVETVAEIAGGEK